MASNQTSRTVPADYVPPRDTLAAFGLHWDSYSNQTFRYDKTRWSDFERPLPRHIQPFTTWRTGAKNHGVKFADLYYAKLDLQAEREWRFVHPLGKGSFGAVALFERVDAQSQNLVDEVVVKSTAARPNDAVDDMALDISQEAALMAQTNDLNEDGMLILRDFKFYREHDQWRYYFEYCPYGDLDRLRIRYKAYGRYLPELFLWHLFFWLSKTALEYSSNVTAWRSIEVEDWGEQPAGSFLLHSDIKPQNILLGPPDPYHESNNDLYPNLYPIPRIADLGLAEVQSISNSSNQAQNLTKGTPVYFPPEIRWRDIPKRTDFYPFGDTPGHIDDDRRKGRHPITSAANIWAIGAIMFVMMTLQEPHRLSDLTENVLGQILPPPPRRDEPYIMDSDMRIHADKYYSMELRDLIKECLCLAPDGRPDEQRLHDQVANAYYARESEALNKFSHLDISPEELVETHPDYKVYYRANEIDRAPDNYIYDHTSNGIHSSWWSHYFVADLPWLLPHWGSLWPDTAPDPLTAPMGWPIEFARALSQEQRNQRQARRQRQGQDVSESQSQLSTASSSAFGQFAGPAAGTAQQQRPLPPAPSQRPLPQPPPRQPGQLRREERGRQLQPLRPPQQQQQQQPTGNQPSPWAILQNQLNEFRGSNPAPPIVSPQPPQAQGQINPWAQLVHDLNRHPGQTFDPTTFLQNAQAQRPAFGQPAVQQQQQQQQQQPPARLSSSSSLSSPPDSLPSDRPNTGPVRSVRDQNRYTPYNLRPRRSRGQMRRQQQQQGRRG